MNRETMISYTILDGLEVSMKYFYHSKVKISCITSISKHTYTFLYLLHLQLAEPIAPTIMHATQAQFHLCLLVTSFGDSKSIFLSNFMFHFCLLNFEWFIIGRKFRIKKSRYILLLSLGGCPFLLSFDLLQLRLLPYLHSLLL